MKKIIVFILSALILIGAVVGIILIASNCNSKKANEENKETRVIKYLKDDSTYVIGEKIVFEIECTSDKELTSLVYKINNGAGVSVASATGETENNENDIEGSGKYFLDSGVEFIDTSTMSEGYYTIVFEIKDVDGISYPVNTKPILITLVSATA
ncbi:MAG: hypothetical protein IJX16_05435 [Clostridia bacterium]|nr:hypothetical protein [Clostridia bacterium]